MAGLVRGTGKEPTVENDLDTALSNEDLVQVYLDPEQGDRTVSHNPNLKIRKTIPVAASKTTTQEKALFPEDTKLAKLTAERIQIKEQIRKAKSLLRTPEENEEAQDILEVKILLKEARHELTQDQRDFESTKIGDIREDGEEITKGRRIGMQMSLESRDEMRTKKEAAFKKHEDSFEEETNNDPSVRPLLQDLDTLNNQIKTREETLAVEKLPELPELKEQHAKILETLISAAEEAEKIFEEKDLSLLGKEESLEKKRQYILKEIDLSEEMGAEDIDYKQQILGRKFISQREEGLFQARKALDKEMQDFEKYSRNSPLAQKFEELDKEIKAIEKIAPTTKGKPVVQPASPKERSTLNKIFTPIANLFSRNKEEEPISTATEPTEPKTIENDVEHEAENEPTISAGIISGGAVSKNTNSDKTAPISEQTTEEKADEQPVARSIVLPEDITSKAQAIAAKPATRKLSPIGGNPTTQPFAQAVTEQAQPATVTPLPNQQDEKPDFSSVLKKTLGTDWDEENAKSIKGTLSWMASTLEIKGQLQEEFNNVVFEDKKHGHQFFISKDIIQHIDNNNDASIRETIQMAVFAAQDKDMSKEGVTLIGTEIERARLLVSIQFVNQTLTNKIKINGGDKGLSPAIIASAKAELKDFIEGDYAKEITKIIELETPEQSTGGGGIPLKAAAAPALSL